MPLFQKLGIGVTISSENCVNLEALRPPYLSLPPLPQKIQFV
jgi:hypothetical protein